MTVAAEKNRPGDGFGMSAAERQDQAAAAALAQAIEALDAAGVPYCYWKRRAKLGRALSGESDLDLLVPRRARDAFCAVMQARGFKFWPDAGALSQPEFANFLGYDESLGRILHVHAHFRLILGDALAKAFHIPIEEALIARSVWDERHRIRVLEPLDEVLVVRLRKALEGGWLDAVAWRRREETPPRDVGLAADSAFLQARAEGFLSQQAAQVLSASPQDVGWRRSARRALRKELKPWRLRGSLATASLLMARTLFVVCAVLDRRYFHAARFARRPAPGGGALIAFAGVDGSGKSTQVARTSRWLESQLDVTTCYFGTGDGSASLMFRPIKAVAEAIGARLRVKPKGASHGLVSDRAPGPVYSLMFALWALAVAWDKRAKLAAARRAVARGFVVITDRYPQNEIPQFNDGPLLHRLPAAPDWLRRLERSIYERAARTPPDLVIKLHANAATVARREPDMRPELIRQRIEWLKELGFGGAKTVSIDAALPLAEVTHIVRRAVWDVL